MDEEEFRRQCLSEVSEQGSSDRFKSLTSKWVEESIKTNYSYHFEWLGRPVIQYPQDLVGTQQLLWLVQPDLIIETGIARGGSLIFYASMLELIAQCGGPPNAKVLGVDIDIRKHNEEAVLKHPMAKRIEMIQGSSIEKPVADEVKRRAASANRVMVCLDSNHTHEHVLQELRLYAPLVSIGAYIIVFDTVVEDLASGLIKDRPWTKGNNPKTAVFEYLQEINDKNIYDDQGVRLQFEIDDDIQSKLMITVAPSGYLRRR